MPAATALLAAVGQAVDQRQHPTVTIVESVHSGLGAKNGTQGEGPDGFNLVAVIVMWARSRGGTVYAEATVAHRNYGKATLREIRREVGKRARALGATSATIHFYPPNASMGGPHRVNSASYTPPDDPKAKP